MSVHVCEIPGVSRCLRLTAHISLDQKFLWRTEVDQPDLKKVQLLSPPVTSLTYKDMQTHTHTYTHLYTNSDIP